jgi:hypothetical protein
VPGNGKALPAFQQEDAACRAYAGEQVAGPPLANNGFTPGTTLQQRYDITYTQCMYSKGNTVLSSANLTGGVRVAAIDYDAYAYPYYGTVFGTGVFVRSRAFRHDHFRGFQHGSTGPHPVFANAHGWTGGRGWGGGHGWSGGRGWSGGHNASGGHGGAVAHGGGSGGGGGAHGGGRG